MTVDNAQFNNLSYSLNTIWNASFLIGLSMYSMWDYLGPSCLSGVVVLLFTLPANSIITRKIKHHKEEGMKFKDLRIKITFEVMDGIKVIKFNAWEKALAKKINEIRDQELNHQRIVSYLTSAQSFFLQAAPVFSAMATFATFVCWDPSNVLTAEKAFVSISYFSIIRHPMEWLPNFFNQITQAYVSIKRMNVFLGAKEVLDSDIDTPTDDKVSVDILNAKFSWGDTSGAFINLNKLRIYKGEVVGIVGRVGQGKSSLLSCLLNDMERKKGSIGVSGSKAYLPSQPFIRNATLRDNILFGEVYNGSWYQSVIQACGLLPDLKLLEHGDGTEIGEKGVNLSGGQKQRVGLARVIYSRRDIYLLDDPLSAVDVHVAKHIFDQCFDSKKGLLAGKTILFVTNSARYLPQMDRVIVLEGGSMMADGEYESVKEHISFLKHASFANNLHRQDSTDTSFHREPNSSANHKMQDSQENSALVSEEKIETERVSKDVYLFYLKTIGFWFALAAVLLHFISQSLLMGTNWWLVKWTSYEENIGPEGGTLFYLLIYSLLGILSVFAVVGATVSVLAGGVSASTAIHQQVLDKVLNTFIGFFESNPRGRIMNRFSTDLSWVDNELPSNYNMAIGAIFEFACIVFAICFVNIHFLITMIPVVLMTGFLQHFFVKASRFVRSKYLKYTRISKNKLATFLDKSRG